MPVEIVKDKWTNKVHELVLGATKEQGGTRSKVIKVGGESCLPFMFQDGQMPNRPVIAMEVWDVEPAEWPDALKAPFGGALKDPALWAKKCVEEFGADLICLVLEGTNPESKNISPEASAETLKKVLKAVGVPLIITGSGDKQKDSEVLSRCSQAARGENCLFGVATQDNYKTLTVSCTADGHSIISESPIDINIAKQVNILITDMGFKPEKVAMHPTSGALGYGMEYVYSIMERGRLAALMGDKMLSMPFILFVGQEVWRVKEASAPEKEAPGWGDAARRGPLWEATTAACMLQAGADILVMRHPEAVTRVRDTIGRLMKK
ncbi:MAG: acetyl-CoA decarbonylase/synthase complex subunit delta [Candidatus Omnitrophica bacterium]|nr:acetyl-CoA decarbonylase/synthase complex subunit delta [Candidatus Omnitrophota bacterium]